MRNVIYIITGIIVGALLGYFLSGTFQSDSQDATPQTEEVEKEQIYTCSMHPQIRQDEPGLCPICNMELIPLDETASDDPLKLQMTPEAVKLAQVETVLVKGKTEKKEGVIELSGHIRVNEKNRVNEVAYFPGKIEKLHVRSEGEYVKKGEKIADMFAPDLRVVQHELISTYQRRKEQPELYSAAARKMMYWQIDKDVIKEIAESGIVRAYLPIYAEHSGYVKTISVTEGDYITRGAKLMEIVNLSSVWVEMNVDESELSRIDRGSTLSFSVLSYPGEEHTATINYIDPFIDPETGTALARATTPNYDGRFKPNMLVKGYISYAQNIDESEILIPASAVLWTGERSVVYVQDSAMDIPTYQYREVQLGKRIKDDYIVTKGINSGERVVKQGAFSIDAAAQLNNQMSMMNQWMNAEQGSQFKKIKLNPIATESWEQAIEHYLKLKEMMVLEDEGDAATMGNNLIQSLENVKDKITSDKASSIWNEWHEEAIQALNELTSHQDIASQRKLFEKLSTAMIYWAQHLDYNEKELFIQHCPMAFDNQGADWISDQKDIRNPYFGEQMLKCGKTIEVVN